MCGDEIRQSITTRIARDSPKRRRGKERIAAWRGRRAQEREKEKEKEGRREREREKEKAKERERGACASETSLFRMIEQGAMLGRRCTNSVGRRGPHQPRSPG